jgi:hypothetical protein
MEWKQTNDETKQSAQPFLSKVLKSEEEFFYSAQYLSRGFFKKKPNEMESLHQNEQHRSSSELNSRKDQW